MTLPRGKKEGMGFHFLAVLSPLLELDHFGTDWTDLSRRSWSWCGMRTDMGGMPDSRYILIIVLVLCSEVVIITGRWVFLLTGLLLLMTGSLF